MPPPIKSDLGEGVIEVTFLDLMPQSKLYEFLVQMEFSFHFLYIAQIDVNILVVIPYPHFLHFLHAPKHPLSEWIYANLAISELFKNRCDLPTAQIGRNSQSANTNP